MITKFCEPIWKADNAINSAIESINQATHCHRTRTGPIDPLYSPLVSFKLLTRDRRKTRRRSLTFCLVSKGKDSFTWINFFSVPSANLDKFWRLAKVFSPVSNLMRMGGAVLDNFCLYDPFVRLGPRRQRRRCGSRRPLWIIVQRVLMNHSPRSLGVCGALLPHPPLNLLSLSADPPPPSFRTRATHKLVLLLLLVCV